MAHSFSVAFAPIKAQGWRIMRDGAAWAAIDPTYISDAESAVGFGPTPESAVADLAARLGKPVPPVDEFIDAGVREWKPTNGGVRVEVHPAD